MRGWRAEIVVLVGLGCVAVVCLLRGLPIGVDSAVYRAGATVALHGQPLYGKLPLPPWVPQQLGFTYPPTAVLVFAPLAVVPGQLGWGLLAGLSALGLGVTRRAGGWGPLVVLAALAAEPVWRSIGLGQVNIVLMAMVLADVLMLRGRKGSGVLIGVAAAVKLTPLVFVLHLFVVGRKADALRALGTFGALTAFAALVLPGDSLRFWSDTLLGGNDATTNSWYGNQSLNGVLQRLTGEAHGTFALVVALDLVVLAAAFFVVRTQHRRGESLAALLVSALAGLLVSPISWTHHWVWAVPAIALLAVRLRSAGSRLVLVAVAVVFTGLTFQFVPRGEHQEVAWTALQHLLGDAYPLCVLVFVGLLLTMPSTTSVWCRAPERSTVPPGRRTDADERDAQLLRRVDQAG